LQNYINSDDIDLLSADYRKAITKNEIINAIQPKVKFTDRGVQKGKWLNKELEML
jgi:hypothetical protein